MQLEYPTVTFAPMDEDAWWCCKAHGRAVGWVVLREGHWRITFFVDNYVTPAQLRDMAAFMEQIEADK